MKAISTMPSLKIMIAVGIALVIAGMLFGTYVL